MVALKIFRVLGLIYAVLVMALYTYNLVASLIGLTEGVDLITSILEDNENKKMLKPLKHHITTIIICTIYLVQSVVCIVTSVVLIFGILWKNLLYVKVYKILFVVISTVGMVVFIVVYLFYMLELQMELAQSLLYLGLEILVMYALFYLILWILDGVVRFIESEKEQPASTDSSTRNVGTTTVSYSVDRKNGV